MNTAIQELRNAKYTESKAIFARILAEENISVTFNGKIKTAAFDVKNRQMILPNYVSKHRDITNMLVGHEVGHALFTPPAQWQGLKNRPKDVRAPQAYYNIVEDARIERKMKMKYFGLTNEFKSGYNYMHKEMDLFGIIELVAKHGRSVISQLPLIDRINLYFKLNLTEGEGLRFDDEEFDLVRMVQNCSTFDEMIEVTEAIYKFAKDKKNDDETPEDNAPSKGNNDKQKKDEKEESDEPGENDDSGDGNDSDDGEGDDSEDASDGFGGGDEEDEDSNSDDDDNGDSDSGDDSGDDDGSDDGAAGDSDSDVDEDGDETADAGDGYGDGAADDSDLDSITNENEEGVIDSLRDTEDADASPIQPAIVPQIDPSKFIVGVKDFMKDVDARGIDHLDTDDFNKFRSMSKSFVNFMAKEFEMKKSAAEYKKTRTARTGKINPNRLHAYKISDDLFARAQIHPEGKNHGLCIMVDWSGSMTGAFSGVIRQLLQLVWFCQKVNLPFEVVTFTTASHRHNNDGEYHIPTGIRQEDWKTGSYMIRGGSRLMMVNILSSTMKTRELNHACKFLWFKMHGQVQSFYLQEGGTPLSESVLVYTSFAKEMKDKYNLDKISNIIITDGEGGTMNEIKDAGTVSWTHVSYLKDEITGKTVKRMVEGGSSEAQIGSFLEILKLRVDGPVIGFYVHAGTRNFYGFTNHVKYGTFNGHTEFRRTLKKEGMVVGQRAGYTKYFVISSQGLHIDVDETELTAGTAAHVSRQLTKRAKGKKGSRKLLGQFIETIA